MPAAPGADAGVLIMFHVIRGLTTAASPEKAAELTAELGKVIEVGSFAPSTVEVQRHLPVVGRPFEMMSFGLDLSKSPSQMMSEASPPV